MLKTWVYNDKKFVSILVDWERYSNPYSTRNEAMWKFDVSQEITEKVRVIKDPETWEIVKKDESKLDERIVHLIIPTINSCLRKEWEAFWSIWEQVDVKWNKVEGTNIAESIKEANKVDDYSDLPFN